MTLLTLPARLKSLYEQSQYHSHANIAQQSFMLWLDNFTKPLTFFPEYTDHGRPHLESVLTSAEALITEDSWKLLTPDDAVLLVLAVLLHDAAMALTEDQFLALVVPTPSSAYPLTAPTLNPNHPEKKFSELFDDFLAEARRWDGRKLINVLGAPDPNEPDDDPISYIQHPDKLGCPEKWTKRHRRFLGEFLRLHHPRLAHHFALYGLPHPTNAPGAPHGNAVVCVPPSATAPHLPNEIPPHLKDLAGLIARSHGIPLRDTFPYFQKFGKNKRAVTHNTHPIYLMAVLRIADFLQIDHTRGADLSAVRKLRSPLSELHWNAQAALEDATFDENDAEALNFTASPNSAQTFLQLQNLLRGSSGLQQELDTTWAILGQVFSRLTKVGDKDLSRFGLTLRRVTSNIDDPQDFLKGHNPEYYPFRATFDASGADLLKLLIEPLYGNRPEIGVRELLQNAVDAVRELDQYCENHQINKSSLTPMNKRSDIVVEITINDDDEKVFSITDNGIGMTADVLMNYFLKAGASFRRSTEWRREYERNNKATILRSGRFGIGVLAAFLLGDSLMVESRFVGSRPCDGVRFRTNGLDESIITLERPTNLSVGTRIEIVLSSYAAGQLSISDSSWDWFTLCYPKVLRKATSGLKQQYKLPSLKDGLSRPIWNRIRADGFADIQWTIFKAPMLTCNGIVVSDEDSRSPSNWHESQVPLKMPRLNVFDPDGRLPLNLQRTELTTQAYPFLGNLLRDVTRNMIAFLLACIPESPALFDTFLSRYSAPITGFFENDSDIIFPPLMLTNHGMTICHRFCLSREKIGRIIWWPHRRGAEVWNQLLKKKSCAVIPFRLDDSYDRHSVDGAIEQLTGDRDMHFIDWSPSTWRLALASRFTEFVDVPGRIVKKTKARVEYESEGFPRANKIKIADSEIKSLDLVAEWIINDGEIDFIENAFTQQMDELLPQPMIPYDRHLRRKKFPKAYAQLGRLIKKWEKWKPKD